MPSDGSQITHLLSFHFMQHIQEVMTENASRLAKNRLLKKISARPAACLMWLWIYKAKAITSPLGRSSNLSRPCAQPMLWTQVLTLKKLDLRIALCNRAVNFNGSCTSIWFAARTNNSIHSFRPALSLEAQLNNENAVSVLPSDFSIDCCLYANIEGGFLHGSS